MSTPPLPVKRRRSRTESALFEREVAYSRLHAAALAALLVELRFDAIRVRGASRRLVHRVIGIVGAAPRMEFGGSIRVDRAFDMKRTC